MTLSLVHRILLIAGFALFAVPMLWLVWPPPGGRLDSLAHPAASYARALSLVDSLRQLDGPGISAECGSKLLEHGHPTPRVVVMFHGLTNCPAQFDSLARVSFARGANVLVPRLPRHGFADRMTGELALSDARELRAFTDGIIDIAHGLGDSLTVVGLSVGGTLTAWAAQERTDVDRAVLIAPMLGVARAPGRWTWAVTRLMERAPNLFVWWNSELKRDLPGPRHVYPRFATRAVAATLRLGAAARARAGREAPRCRAIVMITVGGDIAVDNGLCAALVGEWRRHGARDVTTYEFPAGDHLNHDIVDPEQSGGNTDLTYPVLMRLIGP